MRVNFSDSTSVDVCAEHLWVTWNKRERDKHAGECSRTMPFKGDWAKDPGKIRTTSQLIESLLTGSPSRKLKNHCIPLVTAPLEIDPADLPIHPYVLGCWLGDGTARCGAITNNLSDAAMIVRMSDLGYIATLSALKDSNALWTLSMSAKRKSGRSLKDQLRSLGVLENKHVPDVYLRSSVEQRLELVRGLMDTDGSVGASGQCSFKNTNKRVADAVIELLRSLGERPTVSSCLGDIDGKKYKMQYIVQWTPLRVNPFFLQRKAERVKSALPA